MAFKWFLCTRVTTNTNSWETKDLMFQWAGLFLTDEKVAAETNAPFLYRNILSKNIEAEISEILRIC